MEHLREFLTEHLSWPLAREIVLLAVIAAIAIVSYFIMNYVMRKVKEIVEDTESIVVSGTGIDSELVPSAAV